jgi:hypothetical protein
MKRPIIGWVAVISGFILMVLAYINPFPAVDLLPVTGGEDFVIRKSPMTNLGPIVSLELEYTNNPQEIKIVKNTVMQGYASFQDLNAGEKLFDYKISSLDSQNSTFWTGYYFFPKYTTEPAEGEDTGISEIQPDSFNLITNVPYSSTLNRIEISASGGSIYDTTVIPAASNTNYPLMAPDFSTTGSQNTKLFTIAVLGDKFTDSAQFNTMAQEIKNRILSYPPFNVRQSQIAITPYFTTEDFGCAATSTSHSLYCNYSKIQDYLNSKGIYYNKVIVILNSPNTAGTGTAQLGGTFAMVRNRITEEFDSSLNTALHELCHTLDLDDERSYGSTGNITNRPVRNCLAGPPPYSGWSNMVPLKDYYKGCYNSNWYRTSQGSKMAAGNNGYFNTVSIQLLNSAIDNYAGTFTTEAKPPNTTAYSPLNNANVEGVVKIRSNLFTTLEIHHVELWVDGVLKDVSYSYGYAFADFDYDFGTPGKQNVKIEVRAYDGLNRVGTYETITVNTGVSVTNSPVPAVSFTATPRPSITSTVSPTAGTTYTPAVTNTIRPTNTPTTMPNVTQTITPSFNPTVAITNTPVVSGTPDPASIVCGHMDVNGDGKLTYLDLYPFMQAYGKNCSDPPPPTDGCQGKDVRIDGEYDNKIDYKDLDSFIKRYNGYDITNCYISGGVVNTPTMTPVVTSTSTPMPSPTTTPPVTTPMPSPTRTPVPSPVNTTPPFTPYVTTRPPNTVTPKITTPGQIIFPQGIICGPLDVNGDNKLDYIDYYDYLRAHLHRCNDNVQYGGCGPKDSNNDRYLDYIDSYVFIEYYNLPSCVH